MLYQLEKPIPLSMTEAITKAKHLVWYDCPDKNSVKYKNRIAVRAALIYAGSVSYSEQIINSEFNAANFGRELGTVIYWPDYKLTAKNILLARKTMRNKHF